MYKPVIAVDFDGFITRKDEYPEIGTINKGVCAVLRSIQDSGAIMCLWTCRTENLLGEAIIAAAKEGITFDYINENSLQQIKRYGGDTRKISCNFLLDDKLPLVPPLVQALWVWFSLVVKPKLFFWRNK